MAWLHIPDSKASRFAPGETQAQLDVLHLADEHKLRGHILRAIGNSVDWRVAEYAFVNLWAALNG